MGNFFLSFLPLFPFNQDFCDVGNYFNQAFAIFAVLF